MRHTHVGLTGGFLVRALPALLILAAAGLCRAEAAPSDNALPTGKAPTIKMVMEPPPATATTGKATDGAASPKTAATEPPARAPEVVPTSRKEAFSPEKSKVLPTFSSRYDDTSWEEMLKKGKTLLADVKDNVYTCDEPAYYWLVAHVNKLSPDLLTPDAESVPFTILMEQPAAYRGKPVTISGHFMNVAKFTPPVEALQEDYPTLYECTVREPPLEQTRPLAIVVTSEDPTLTLEPGDEVRVKGYFYKVRQYEGTRGIGYAPVIIAQALLPLHARPVGGKSSGGVFSDPYLILMILAIVAMMVAFVMIKQRLRGKTVHAPAKRPVAVHKFRLRRPDLGPPPAGSGPGSEGGGPKP
jgi:hypothetical protein